tara:strand:+ start:50 stop:328 length:279 start_codon:yes stop_codon:yes gene_type:complete
MRGRSPTHSSPRLRVRARLSVVSLPAAHTPTPQHTPKSSLLQRTATHCNTLQPQIMCAGAIHTPKLLMLSGVGDEGHLRKHDIDVVQHSPQP